MAIRELNKKEFLATFVSPMRVADGDTAAKAVDIENYVVECIAAHHLTVKLEEIGIETDYISADNKFLHILHTYGEKNKYLVVIVDNEKSRAFGHYFLDLNEEYGL